MDRPDEKIKQHIPQDELLAQLAEECAVSRRMCGVIAGGIKVA